VGQKPIIRLTDRTARRGGLISGVTLLAALAFTPSPALAQVQDTLRADTLGVDSLLVEQDTLLPPPVMVAWPRPDSSAGLVDGRWVWDEDALLNEGAISLIDLLNRVPGVTTFRSGVLLQPEAASAFGGGADRLVVIWDGFVLDPLAGAALDLSTIRLSHLERVEIERRPDALVIRLFSDAATDARPYSRIEAGVGQPEVNLFRGVLLVPRFLFGPFGFAVDRIEVQGAGRAQPADVFNGWVRWGLLSERRGLEFTFRNDGLSREQGSPAPADISRRDLVVRGRSRFGLHGVAEGYFGRSTIEYDQTDTAIPDSLRVSRSIRARQAGLRLAWALDRAQAEGALRWRDDERLPSLDLELNGRFRPIDPLRIDAGIVNQRWDEGLGATSWFASASFTPLPWLTAFGSFADGRRAARSGVDSIPVPNKGSRQVGRGGVEARLGGFRAAVAGVRMSADSVPLFRLPGDTIIDAVGAGTVTGWEASGSLPLAGDWLSLEAAWSAWVSGLRPVYTPASIGRATVLLHTAPLESGNFELTARMDVRQRGELVGGPLEPDGPLAPVPARTLIDAYVQIRIIDIRVWVRFDDMAGNDVQDLPGLFVQGPRVFYGVKWNFWN
jgi:hypothetical protein